MHLCAKCHVNERLSYHSYCRDCRQQYRKDNPEDRSKKYKRVAPFPELCGKCHKHPHATGHAWCKDCKNEATREWWRQNPTWRCSTEERRKKANARQFVHNHLLRGKLFKLPCFICGEPIVTAHHYLGYEKEHAGDVLWLCVKHHREAEQKLWSPIVPANYSQLTRSNVSGLSK